MACQQRNREPVLAVVLKLVPRSNADTVAVFKCLLERAIADQIDGSIVTVRTRSGDEEVYFTGPFHHKPSEAANAAIRLCWEIAQAQDEGRPPGRSHR